jgi:hypothetical protein
MSEDNVIDFNERATEKAREKAEAAGAERLMQDKGFKPMAKQVAKGKKVSQQAAFNAMVQMKDLMDGQGMAVQRLSQMLLMLEQTIQRIDMHFGVLMHILMEKDIFTEDDWKEGWNKHVVEPERQRVKDTAEAIKQDEETSEEDKFFSDVILKVLDFEFSEEVELEDGNKVDGGALQDFFLNRLLNPQFRRLVLDDVRKHIPDIPEFEPEVAKNEEVVATKHPECHYCGKPECPHCNPLPDDVENTDEDPEPDPPEAAVA